MSVQPDGKRVCTDSLHGIRYRYVGYLDIMLSATNFLKFVRILISYSHGHRMQSS